jgi:hypothetical protein
MWADGQSATDDYCGEQVVPERPYCAEHHKLSTKHGKIKKPGLIVNKTKLATAYRAGDDVVAKSARRPSTDESTAPNLGL